MKAYGLFLLSGYLLQNKVPNNELLYFYIKVRQSPSILPPPRKKAVKNPFACIRLNGKYPGFLPLPSEYKKCTFPSAK